MRDAQELFERRVKARSLSYLFVAGALLGLLTLVFPHDDEVKDEALVALAGAAIVIGGLFYVRAERVRETELHLAVATGTVILALANYWVSATALYPILFSWTALYAFYFFDLRLALGHLALIGVLYAVVLVLSDVDSGVVRWILAVGTPAVAGVLISRLLDQLRGEAARAAERTGELRATEGRTRLILESAPEPFVSIDADGLVAAWNASAEQAFGWTASEAMGQPLRGLVLPPEAREAHDERRARLFAAEPSAVERVELELQRRDGSRFPGELTLSRVVVADEVFLSGFIRDLSERRRREEQRDQLLREQAARAEAERVAEMVSGMQVLVDAALAHRKLSDMLVELVPRVRAVLGADAVAIFLADEGERLTLAASSVGPPSDGPIAAFGEGFGGRVAESRRPLLDNDPIAEELLDPAVRDLDISSVIGVPLEARGTVTGVITVCAESPRHFTDEDLGMLRLAADRVALAVDHARVYEREHKIAETLQRSLLPERLPQLPGMAVAARYQPAASEAEVGGDWYDVISIPGGGVGLVMGDVAGKGLAAASMVGRLRSALRAYALEGHDPQTVVERLNRVVFTELEESQMATLVYLVLDPAEGRLRWVNAGHLPPALVGREGTRPRFLEGAKSVPLGVMPFPSFEEQSADAEPGATVILYTDGLVERPGDHLDSGLGRLADAVAAAPTTPDGLCDHLLASLVPEGGASDDVALLALQNLAISESFSVELPTTPEALASMRGLLRRWLREAEGSEQEIAEITTACGEAANNAIEHAGSQGDTPFELDGRLEGRRVDITVRDYGAWRTPRDGDRGRGLSLMRALMDDVDVTPSPEGTTVRMKRTLNGGST